MYHRIVEVDSPGTKLRIENGSLKIETAEGRSAHFRTEELDCVLLSHPGVSLSNGALAELMAANVQEDGRADRTGGRDRQFVLVYRS